MESIVLPNGLRISGTHEQVFETARKLGYGSALEIEYYMSETKGALRIREMNTTHLRNAILKFYREWVESLHKISNPEKLVAVMTMGITDRNWLAMVKEYYTRDEE